MDHFPPDYLDHFLAPIRDSPQAQTALMALLLLIVLDVVLGVAAAAKNHDIQSAEMREGAWHKIGELGVVVISDIADGMLMGGLDIGFSAPVCTAVIVYLCINEVVSVDGYGQLIIEPKGNDLSSSTWIFASGTYLTDQSLG
jgi:phage-related holin